MKSRSALLNHPGCLLAASLFASGSFAGDVDPRFDGRWVGTETFQYGTAGFWRTAGGGATLVRFQTVLGISDHGKTVGITKGYAPERYEVVPAKSGGNKLEFQMLATETIFVSRAGSTVL